MPREAPVTSAVLLCSTILTPYRLLRADIRTSVGCRATGDRRNTVAFIQKPICFKNKILVILVPTSMVAVGIEDQLGIRHVLNQIQSLHRVNDTLLIPAHPQRRPL